MCAIAPIWIENRAISNLLTTDSASLVQNVTRGAITFDGHERHTTGEISQVCIPLTANTYSTEWKTRPEASIPLKLQLFLLICFFLPKHYIVHCINGHRITLIPGTM